jgi:hypothetical protein
MSEEIVPKKLTLFELMDRVFIAERQRMEQVREQLNKSVFNMYDLQLNPVIKMENMEDFQNSIEEFKKANPNAKISARAYTFNSEKPEENQVFEYNEQEKLPEKKTNKKKTVKKKKK